ncbi:MAG TPA: thioredoxin domain-containing protein [Solirubrobacterales bacterium]
MQGLREDRLSYLPLALVVPVVAVAVIVATSGGPSVAASKSFSAGEKSAIRRTEKLLAGIPQRGAALGDPKAPVTLQFFGDLQCVDSRWVMLGALPFLIRHWVRGGDLRIVYRSTETDTHDAPEFREQQGAAMAAGRQGKMWTFVDLFYREQQPEFTHYADDAYLEGIAEQTGVDMRHWARDRETGDWPRLIESDEALAWSKELPGRSTPSFLIGPTGGEARPVGHFSLNEAKVFDEAIRALL